MSVEKTLVSYLSQIRRRRPSSDAMKEAKRRVLDALGCFFGAFDEKPVRVLREVVTKDADGRCRVWGTRLKAPPEIAALANGSGVRALDFNDTYLSKEPCHPSDMIASLWAATELSAANGRRFLEGLVLAYDVLCRLCDAASLRLRGWDHVTYLPIATAVGCAHVMKLSAEQAGHAIALAATGNNALRQTRVGTISDWKAACAAYAARSGFLACRLARAGFTGPSDIFSGRHGFFAQLSGPFRLASELGGRWKILSTHIKYFPAEHHAQSAIEAALALRAPVGKSAVKKITIECFKVAVDIIGSEKEKWRPTTRETADHSMPYLTVAALLDGDVTQKQFERKRYLDKDVKKLLSKVAVVEVKKYSAMYPAYMPSRVRVKLENGAELSAEVLRPRGYAGRPLADDLVEVKFRRQAGKYLSDQRMERLTKEVFNLDKKKSLSRLSSMLII